MRWRRKCELFRRAGVGTMSRFDSSCPAAPLLRSGELRAGLVQAWWGLLGVGVQNDAILLGSLSITAPMLGAQEPPHQDVSHDACPPVPSCCRLAEPLQPTSVVREDHAFLLAAQSSTRPCLPGPNWSYTEARALTRPLAAANHRKLPAHVGEDLVSSGASPATSHSPASRSSSKTRRWRAVQRPQAALTTGPPTGHAQPPAFPRCAAQRASGARWQPQRQAGLRPQPSGSGGRAPARGRFGGACVGRRHQQHGLVCFASAGLGFMSARLLWQHRAPPPWHGHRLKSKPYPYAA